MKQQAKKIINLIEQSGFHDKGEKFAHARGENYEGTVELNEEGRALFGAQNKATIRLSDAPPNKRTPSWKIPLKGLAIHFTGEEPIDLVYVTFPYFPWEKAESIVQLATYGLAIEEAGDDALVKANLIKKMFELESFDKNLWEFVKNQPVSPIRNHRKYYNPHFYQFGERYVRFYVEYKDEEIIMFASYFNDKHSIKEMPEPVETVELGQLKNLKKLDKGPDFHEVLNTGPNFKVLEDDEIIHLRHEMYQISNERRKNE